MELCDGGGSELRIAPILEGFHNFPQFLPQMVDRFGFTWKSKLCGRSGKN